MSYSADEEAQDDSGEEGEQTEEYAEDELEDYAEEKRRLSVPLRPLNIVNGGINGNFSAKMHHHKLKHNGALNTYEENGEKLVKGLLNLTNEQLKAPFISAWQEANPGGNTQSQSEGSYTTSLNTMTFPLQFVALSTIEYNKDQKDIIEVPGVYPVTWVSLDRQFISVPKDTQASYLLWKTPSEFMKRLFVGSPAISSNKKKIGRLIPEQVECEWIEYGIRRIFFKGQTRNHLLALRAKLRSAQDGKVVETSTSDESPGDEGDGEPAINVQPKGPKRQTASERRKKLEDAKKDQLVMGSVSVEATNWEKKSTKKNGKGANGKAHATSKENQDPTKNAKVPPERKDTGKNSSNPENGSDNSSKPPGPMVNTGSTRRNNEIEGDEHHFEEQLDEIIRSSLEVGLNGMQWDDPTLYSTDGTVLEIPFTNAIQGNHQIIRPSPRPTPQPKHPRCNNDNWLPETAAADESRSRVMRNSESNVQLYDHDMGVYSGNNGWMNQPPTAMDYQDDNGQYGKNGSNVFGQQHPSQYQPSPTSNCNSGEVPGSTPPYVRNPLFTSPPALHQFNAGRGAHAFQGYTPTSSSSSSINDLTSYHHYDSTPPTHDGRRPFETTSSRAFSSLNLGSSGSSSSLNTSVENGYNPLSIKNMWDVVKELRSEAAKLREERKENQKIMEDEKESVVLHLLQENEKLKSEHDTLNKIKATIAALGLSFDQDQQRLVREDGQPFVIGQFQRGGSGRKRHVEREVTEKDLPFKIPAGSIEELMEMNTSLEDESISETLDKFLLWKLSKQSKEIPEYYGRLIFSTIITVSTAEKVLVSKPNDKFKEYRVITEFGTILSFMKKFMFEWHQREMGKEPLKYKNPGEFGNVILSSYKNFRNSATAKLRHIEKKTGNSENSDTIRGNDGNDFIRVRRPPTKPRKTAAQRNIERTLEEHQTSSSKKSLLEKSKNNIQSPSTGARTTEIEGSDYESED